MENKVTKNQIALSKGDNFQVELVQQVDLATKEMGRNLSEYGTQCVINALASLVLYCRQNDIKFSSFDLTMVKLALINVGYTELNMAAIPSEAYFDIRKVNKEIEDKETGETKTTTTYAVTIKPQGAGNEKLTRKYGVNVKELQSALLIREGDEYELPGFDGVKMTPFTWKRKSLDSKIIMVVYPLEKTNGAFEYLIASREGIKPNIIAQIRQNTLYKFKKKNAKGYDVNDPDARDAFYAQLDQEAESMKVDDLIKKYAEYVNPTYTSGGSREQMILRKMKNNALKNYPKEYDNAYMKAAVEGMFEDRDDSLNIKREEAIDADAVEEVEKQINETIVDQNAPADFEVQEAEPIPEPEKVEVKVERKPAPKSDNYDEDL